MAKAADDRGGCRLRLPPRGARDRPRAAGYRVRLASSACAFVSARPVPDLFSLRC